MKKILLLFAALLSISVSAQNKEQKRVDKQTTQWRYELQAAVGQAAEGACLVRVWTYSSKPTIAEGQAGKNAVHGILFKGYPASSDGTRISGREPMISNPAIEEEYSEYFAEFFKSGGAYQRYVSYIGNGIPDAQIKVGKEYKVGITVIVLIDQLRKRLEEDGIIQALKVEGKLPTIMVVPSAMWCNQHGFVLKYENQGQVETLPDYEKAMMGSPELASTINALNARMAKRGFPLKDLDAALKTVKNESAEESLMTSSMGDAIAETPIDILRRTAKADIWIEVEWYTTAQKGGSMTSLTFSMNALDAYTDMSVAGVSPTTSKPVYTSSFQLPIMMESAIQSQFDGFCNSLETYFSKLNTDGRAIKLRVLTWDSFEEGLMAEYDDVELNEIIEDWLEKNTVKGKFGAPEISPSGNRMTVENVRIPVKNAKGRDLDPRTWARGLQKMLRSEYGIESQLSTKGLGQIQLILGDK